MEATTRLRYFTATYRSSGTAFGRLNVFVINETLGDLGT